MYEDQHPSLQSQGEGSKVDSWPPTQTFWKGISVNQLDEFQRLKNAQDLFDNETSRVTEYSYSTQKFNRVEVVLICMFGANSLIYFHFYNDVTVAVYLQISLSLVNGMALMSLGLKWTTLPFLFAILATLLGIALMTVTVENRILMVIPVLYPLGVRGVQRKFRAVWSSVKRESIWMFLSIALVFYLFGYIIYRKTFEVDTNFNNPIHASVSLFQIATFDDFGDILKKTIRASGHGTLVWLAIAVLVFHVLTNINQALIIKYVLNKSAFDINKLWNSLFQIAGIEYMEQKAFRYVNLFCTILPFVVPFQNNLTVLYLALSVVSTVSITIQQYKNGKILRYRSISNLVLETLTFVVLALEEYDMVFLLCCCRITLIKQVVDLWRKIGKVIGVIYPMLSFIGVFYVLFALLVFSARLSSVQTMLVNSLSMLTYDNWVQHLRVFPWYFRIVLVLFLVVGNSLLTNSLISQAFSQLEHPDESKESEVSDTSIRIPLQELSPEKKFVNVLTQLKFQGFRVGNKVIERL